ncbi:MAG: DMT family protein [Oligoflexia bacterium]|nr:DMT family protein [Oligoflexia bacterium]
MIKSISLLLIANVFMTIAWYAHLKTMSTKPLWIVILFSWMIALLEYCFQVPANRIGYQYFSLPQLKVMQEILTMSIFAIFCVLYMKVPLTKNFLYASACLILAAFFIFRDLPKH